MGALSIISLFSDVYQKIKSEWNRASLWSSPDQQAAINALFDTLMASEEGAHFNGYIQVCALMTCMMFNLYHLFFSHLLFGHSSWIYSVRSRFCWETPSLNDTVGAFSTLTLLDPLCPTAMNGDVFFYIPLFFPFPSKGSQLSHCLNGSLTTMTPFPSQSV